MVKTILLDKFDLGQRDLDRFNRKVDKIRCAGCWRYPGSVVDGYIQHRISGTRKFIQAHRLSYIVHKGDIPEGLLILHTCDYRRCVNPDHLFLGTHKINAEDKESKGRGNQPKGEDNHASKLSDNDVRRMRKMYRKGVKGNTKMLMKIFKVTQSTVYGICNDISWRHVK